MSDDERDNQHDDEANQMRYALTAIASELQKFQNITSSTNETVRPEDILSALVICKRNLKMKKDQIRTLKQNLKTACSVAKTLSAARDSETASLKNQLYCARNQYWDLDRQQKEKIDLINTLRIENQTFRDKLQCYNNFIQLGYQELQNVRNENSDDIPSLKKLQKIILHCGQYFAESSNLREKCSQLEQKNRFLKSKLCILESYLDTTSKELQNLQGCSSKYHKETEGISSTLQQCSNVHAVFSECQMGNNNNFTNFKMTKIELDKQSLRNITNLDLTCHLSTVKKLLQDQETLIQDLNCLSKELNVDYF